MSKNTERCSMLSCGKPIKRRDEGWSWVVLFASFTVQLLCDGTINGYGVIYAAIKNDTHFAKNNYSEEQIALPGAIQSCLYVISMGLVGPLINVAGFQLVACLGSALAGFSVVAAVFFKDIAGMIVFYGVFAGLGFGSLYLCACIVVTYYFQRYRGIAFGIAAAGNGLGYMVVPIILSTLSSYFGTAVGWRSGVLVFSTASTGITFLCGLTFRPIEIEAPTEEEIQEIETKQEPTTSCSEQLTSTQLETINEKGIWKTNEVYSENSKEPSEVTQPATSRELFVSAPWISGSIMEGKECSKHSQLWRKLTAGDRKANPISSTFSPSDLDGDQPEPVSVHRSNPSISQHRRLEPSYVHSKPSSAAVHSVIARALDRPDSLFTSNLYILPTLDRSISSLHMDVCKGLNLIEKLSVFGEDKTCLSTVSSEIREHQPPSLSKSFTQKFIELFDLTLFCNTAFLIITVSTLASQLAYFVPFVYFYTFAIEAGLTKEDVLLLIMILGILHTFGRLLGGILANIPRLDWVILTVVSHLLCGACHFSLPFLPHNFTALALYSGGFAFFCAVPCPITVLIFVRFLGLHRLTMAMSNSSLIRGIMAAVGPTLAAYIKNSSGTLDGTFYWCGSCFTVAGLLLLLLYLPQVNKNSEANDMGT